MYKNLHSSDILILLEEKKMAVMQLKQPQAETGLWRLLKIQKPEDRCSQPRAVGSCLPNWQTSMGLGRNIWMCSINVQSFNVSRRSRISLHLVPATDRTALSLFRKKWPLKISRRTGWIHGRCYIAYESLVVILWVLFSSFSSSEYACWSCVLLTIPKAKIILLISFYQPQYLNATQTLCPDIFCYLTSAVITKMSGISVDAERANKSYPAGVSHM